MTEYYQLRNLYSPVDKRCCSIFDLPLIQLFPIPIGIPNPSEGQVVVVAHHSILSSNRPQSTCMPPPFPSTEVTVLVHGSTPLSPYSTVPLSVLVDLPLHGRPPKTRGRYLSLTSVFGSYCDSMPFTYRYLYCDCQEKLSRPPASQSVMVYSGEATVEVSTNPRSNLGPFWVEVDCQRWLASPVASWPLPVLLL